MTAGKGAAFLACRWHELFDEFTPDTFHPKLFSLPSVVSEATMIGGLHEDHEAWSKHLKKVQEEIGERLERGLEKAFCSPRHLGMLERLRKTPTPSEVAGIGRVLELEGFSGLVESGVCNQLRDLNIDEAGKRKADADTLLTSLATHAFRRGCASDDCNEIEQSLAHGGEEVRQWILRALPGSCEDFDCIVAVSAADSKIRAAIRAVCEGVGVIVASPRFPGLPEIADVIFLRRNTSGMRALDAATTLKAEIQANLNLLGLYRQQLAPKIHPGAWVIKDGQANPVANREASFRNLHPRRDAVSLAEKAALALHPREESAIRSALDLHNLALSMADHRLRLVNLWSALECLASLVEGESIISRVERLVCPILTWRKIEKVVRYLAISIHGWLNSNPCIDRNSLPFRLGHNDSVPAERILALLTEPLNAPGIRALLSCVMDHPLLVHRVNAGWEYFHNPKNLKSELTRSERRLGWHLWRIYRARNLLVHQGIESECLPQLANHLQQYLSWTLSRLLHGLTFGEKWTGRDSWCFWKSKAEHVMDSLIAQPEVLTMGDMFPEELRDPGIQLWVPAAISQ